MSENVYVKQWRCNLCGCCGDRCTCIGSMGKTWFCASCLFKSASPDKTCRGCGHDVVLNQATRVKV